MGLSLIELAKTVDLRQYMELRGVEFKSEKPNSLAFCPFHAHNGGTPSVGVKNSGSGQFFNCLACGTAGDVVKFVQYLDKLTPVLAAKKVLDDNNITYVDDGEKISDEQRAEIETANYKRETAYLETQSVKKREVQEAQAKTRAELKIKAPKYANALVDLHSEIHEQISAKFPHQSPLFQDWRDTYLGYDPQHDALVTIIRDGDEYFNTKHYLKYVWDKDLKKFTQERKDGKWIGAYFGTVSPFPIEYFRQHQSQRVILCEGEKDALNLLSYNVNALTLGGVTNSWKEYSELLKDKIVFIWYDNDNAGYLNAIKTYNDLKEQVKDIFIVPFYKINAGLDQGYDISDYLSDNAEKINSAEDIFSALAYSSFKLHNELIDEMGEFCGLDFDKEKTLSKTHTFRDIKKEWIKSDAQGNFKYLLKVRGESDDALMEQTIDELKRAKKGEGYETFKRVMSSVLFAQDEKKKEADELYNLIDRALDIKLKLFNEYRQTHIVDMFNALIKMADKSSFSFGEFRSELAIWTGTHFMVIEDIYLSKFIHKQWMFHAQVDVKKQSKQNVDLIVENIKSKAMHLDEIKEEQNRRVINLLNGTFFISQKGKITFKDIHEKKDAATNLLNFSYELGAKAPKWNKFLNRVLPDKDDQKVLLEFMGYCLIPGHDYEAFLFLYGKSGANGKSVILDIIKSFFGDENVAALQLQQFTGHELHALNNKILNIGSEIDSKGLDKGQLPTLKALVSPKDGVQINPKNKDSYTLLASEKPKLAFAGNSKPKQGLDDAVFRRMILLSFDEEIKDDEKIRDLSDRFSDERSGIFNQAIEGAHRLIRNGKFTKSSKMKAELESYKDEINPIRSYIKDNVELDSKIMVPKNMVYLHYRTWAEAKGNMPLSAQRFWNKLKDEMSTIDTTGKQIRMDEALFGQERPRFIEGIFLKKEDVVSFVYEKSEIITAALNRDIETKAVVIKDNQ